MIFYICLLISMAMLGVVSQREHGATGVLLVVVGYLLGLMAGMFTSGAFS